MPVSLRQIVVFCFSLGWYFITTQDLPGQGLPSEPGDPLLHQKSYDLSEFPEFIVESTPQSTEGYYIFDITPYIVIIDHFGKTVFYRYIPGGTWTFEKQADGRYSFYSISVKGFLVMNGYFQITDTFKRAGESLVDFHDFNILDNGNYNLIGFDRRVVDMSQYVEGGHEFATINGMFFQELDPDKNLLFEWNSWDHISFMESDPYLVDLTTQAIDYIHINSIALDSDGNFIITCRNLSEVTKIDRTTGEIIWRMGGVKNEFDFLNDTLGFSGPHSAIRLPNGNIALLDNGCGHEPQFSRGVEYVVDEAGKTATLVHDFRASTDLYGSILGSVSSLPLDHLVVGWGKNSTNAFLDEFNEDGELVTSIMLPPESLFKTYRVSFLERFDLFIVPDKEILDFGDVEIGDSAELILELSNQGVDPATLFGIADASGQFEISSELPLQITEGATEQVILKFKPTLTGYCSSPVYLRFTLDSTILDDHMIACRLMLNGHSTVASSRKETGYCEEIKIYPNPFTTSLFIEGAGDVDRIVLWTIMGRKIYQLENSGGERILINLSGLPAGIYSVEVISRDGTRKFAKALKEK